jgi:hypothetical protein
MPPLPAGLSRPPIGYALSAVLISMVDGRRMRPDGKIKFIGLILACLAGMKTAPP